MKLPNHFSPNYLKRSNLANSPSIESASQMETCRISLNLLLKYRNNSKREKDVANLQTECSPYGEHQLKGIKNDSSCS